MHRFVSLIAFLLCSTALSAHDMWIEPTAFTPDAGKVIGLKLRVGQDLLGDPLPRDPALIDEFVIVDAQGRRQVPGRDGGDPAGLVRAAAPGLSIVGYSSKPSPITMDAAKFNQYLAEEGLDAVADARAHAKATDAPAREAFARCAKSLILVGAPGEQQMDRALGFTLELVAERNPYTLAPGSDLPVRLLYRGQPLRGALVIAINKKNPSARVAVRSDAQGRVHLPLREGGLWLVKAVHMVPAAAGSGAEWNSYWASLTFDMSQPAAMRAAR